MVMIDIEMPKCCGECPLIYDCMGCLATGKRIDFEKMDSERRGDCPLHEITDKQIMNQE